MCTSTLKTTHFFPWCFSLFRFHKRLFVLLLLLLFSGLANLHIFLRYVNFLLYTQFTARCRLWSFVFPVYALRYRVVNDDACRMWTREMRRREERRGEKEKRFELNKNLFTSFTWKLELFSVELFFCTLFLSLFAHLFVWLGRSRAIAAYLRVPITWCER